MARRAPGLSFRPFRRAVLAALLVAASLAAGGRLEAGEAGPGWDGEGSPILAGAARVNITPFTLTDEMRACRDDPTCPYHEILRLTRPSASNRDGLPGGLFDRIGEEMAGPAASDDWIGPTGVWGESFVDSNTNGRFDQGEEFTDDPANSSSVPGPGYPGPMGDPQSSSGHYDGVFLAGYGNDRIAVGAFDRISARVIFLRDLRTGLSLAWVALDLTGYFSDFVGRIRARLPAELDVDEIVLSHTHDHEAPDTVGLWGQDLTDDGTYPRYEIYIEAKVAQAIEIAAAKLRPARFRFGSIHPGETFLTPRGNAERLDGLMGRNSCRTPWFFDDELRAMQVVTDRLAPNGRRRTIATFLNWSAHVESLDAGNHYISSDFPIAARMTVASQLGGVVMYVPGAQGAVEIVGDSCNRRWHRETFDGQTFPVDEDGDPVVFDPYDHAGARERTYAIGRVVGAAAVAALEGRRLEFSAPRFELLGPRLLCFPVNNQGLAALAEAGVIDKPFTSPECPAEGGTPRARTHLYALRIGKGSFVTAPGEVAPELYYGDETTNRASGIGDYVNANPDALACAARSHHGDEQPGAHSDRPAEPNIRDAQRERFGSEVTFLVGYTPDLLGYVVPGYDFFWVGGPGGFGLPVEEAEDPCAELPPDLSFPEARYGSHYHETNSAGSMLGPAVACEVVRLLDDPLGQGDGTACAEWDLTDETGHPPPEPPPAGYEPGCPIIPEACSIRHY